MFLFGAKKQLVKPFQWKTDVFGDLWSEHESLASCYWEINVLLPNICWQLPNSWMGRRRNDKYVNLQCVVFFSQCTKLEWGFVKSLFSFFFKPPPFLSTCFIIEQWLKTGGKRILSLKFFTFIGVHSLWIDILIWFHTLYPQQLERRSEKERKGIFRDKLFQEHAKRAIKLPSQTHSSSCLYAPVEGCTPKRSLNAYFDYS